MAKKETKNKSIAETLSEHSAAAADTAHITAIILFCFFIIWTSQTNFPYTINYTAKML